MHRFFSSEFFNFEFLRILSTAPTGGCEIGEALEAVQTIRDGDAESWSQAWLIVAARAEALAEEAASGGDTVAARGAYLRASNYYRASQYMLSSCPSARDPRVLTRYEKCVELFRKGVVLNNQHEVVFFDIPYEDGHSMPAYLYLPTKESRKANQKIPLIINVNGGDSILEELFFICPSAAPQLGYAVLVFDGPGQGAALRRNNTPKRPDYEVAIGIVLDLLQRKQYYSKFALDESRIALLGASMGGYYVLRAAADPRIKACVSVDPPYDMWELIASKLPNWFVDGWASGWISDSVVNNIVHLFSRLNFQLKWEISHMMWAFGVDTPAEALKQLKMYTLGPIHPLKDQSGFLSRVDCPVLVTGAAASLYFRPEQSCQRIYNELSHLSDSQRNLWIGRDIIDGGLQAKIAAFSRSNQNTFAFLDNVFRITRESIL